MSAGDPYADVDLVGAPEWLAIKLVGPMVSGYAAQLIFYGLFFALFASFCFEGQFRRLPGKANKAVLIALFVLITGVTAITFDAMYKLASFQDRTSSAIIAGPDESVVLTMLGGFVGALTQTALTRRAATFIDKRWQRIAFYAVLFTLIIGGLFGSVAATVVSYIWIAAGTSLTVQLQWSTCIAVWLWSSAVADCVISGTLAFALYHRMSGFNEQTDSLLKRLAWYGLRSASYTAVVAMGGAIAASIFRDTVIEWSNLSVAFWAPLPALYGIAYFTTLASSRRAVETTFGTSHDLPTHSKGGQTRAGSSNWRKTSVALGLGTRRKRSRSMSSVDERSFGSLYRGASRSRGSHKDASASRGGTSTGPLQVHVEREVVRCFDEPSEGDLIAVAEGGGRMRWSVHSSKTGAHRQCADLSEKAAIPDEKE
ncbi:hypothetical protein Rhopal_005080-T1 [Rhodotorula paludigena]|uniref:DUF6534 domain-containing protein n=1 Tax=Rhodotorula paludigena TaxID=86838 RepID=A0AAV5GRS0_9BASI|nr:hypothetical protein Rhopal_005080-T1 [Rhodotorula paludigena]